MTFDDLLNELRDGRYFEDIAIDYYNEHYNECCMVECIGNIVYEDEDLYDFMVSIGAEIDNFCLGFALISTSNGKYYEIPYEEKPNRFGDDLPDETVLLFDINRIYDVTENYI